MRPSTISIVRDFIARQTESHVPSIEPGIKGQVANYDASVAQLGLKICESAEEFKALDEQFRATPEGQAILEMSRKYWDNPEWAENQRREIAERKRTKR